MARQSPKRRNAEEPEADLDEVGVAADSDDDLAAEADAVDPDETDDTDDEADTADETGDRSLWTEARIDPVEIALPAGLGYTLRAYRLTTDLTPTDIEGRDDDDLFADRVRPGAEDDEDDVVILDDEFTALLEAEPERPGRRGRADSDAAADDADEEPDFSDEADEAEAVEAEADEEPEAEEVPAFLTHRGKLLLFKSPESLVAFVRSGATHDLAQLDTWARFAEQVGPDDVQALDEDSYELDLVVENLRGGHDTWDLDLLIHAGEVARDLAYALRLRPVLTALSPGSPLDDLDEALRAAASGGFAGFRGRRRLRRIGAQQASLGWRSVIGKISAAVDWRD
ncbi:MAG TPA: DNA primase [Pilimelia sp.]|nr:DNA primase [Pilimelia sp.]